jgi:hypothetical protein
MTAKQARPPLEDMLAYAKEAIDLVGGREGAMAPRWQLTGCDFWRWRGPWKLSAKLRRRRRTLFARP